MYQKAEGKDAKNKRLSFPFFAGGTWSREGESNSCPRQVLSSFLLAIANKDE